MPDRSNKSILFFSPFEVENIFVLKKIKATALTQKLSVSQKCLDFLETW